MEEVDDGKFGRPGSWRSLFAHEWRLACRSYGFRLCWGVVLCVFLCGTFVFARQWKVKQQEYEQNVASRIGERDNWSLTQVALSEQEYLFEPRLSSLIDPCAEQQLPSLFVYHALGVLDVRTSFPVANPLEERHDTFSWAFVVTTLLSFLALLLSFNAIAGERERHTLGFLLSWPVRRSTLLVAKFCCVEVQLGAMLLTGMGVGLGVLGLSGVDGILEGDFLGMCLGFFGYSLLLLGVYVSFGLFASALCRHSANSLLLCVICWLLSVIVLPDSRNFVARYLFPMPTSLEEVRRDIAQAEEQVARETPMEAFGNDESDPFYPPHEERARLNRRLLQVRLDHYADYHRLCARQYERTNRLLSCSPVLLFHQLNEQWLDAGYARCVKNGRALNSFCSWLLMWFRFEDARDPQSTHWISDRDFYLTSRRPVSEAVVPVPVYQEPKASLLLRLRSSLPYLLAMAGMGGLLFGLAMWRMKEYDVR